MKFGLLGPLTITADDGTPLEVRGAKLRVLLATLLCHANQPVSGDALIAAVWGPAPPRRADASLRVYVHHLRQALGAARIVRSAAGYRLVVQPGELDLDRFRELLAQGRVAEALGLWRGSALAGLTDVPALAAEADALEELRLDALEQRIELDLTRGWPLPANPASSVDPHRRPPETRDQAAESRDQAAETRGRPAELAAELRGLVNRHPLRETFRGQLMRALVAAGRAAEAAAVYDETRRLLAAELGMEPTAQLRDLHLAILREDPALQPPAAGAHAEADPDRDPEDQPSAAGRIVPRQLPADLAGFSGREEPLAELDRALDDGVRVAAVEGTAGIGKTTLAVHWAHRVAERFPDGQLYVNLHGFDPARAPVEPAAALARFLDTLGVPPRRIPADATARAALFRELVADRRLLVVLDNAHDAAQIRPLRPESGFTLVTSRVRLGGADRTVALDLLTPDEAGRLLRARLGPRADAEPPAVDAIVTACAGLPLALSIVASRAAVLYRFPLTAIVGELHQDRHALDGFASDDASIDLRAVFSWSYRVLPEPAAALFRLLALHPGPDATVRSAASLAGRPVSEAAASLIELGAASLLGEPVPGRFAFHDLLRAYAGELSESLDQPGVRDAAVRRVLQHYVTSSAAAVRVLDARQEPVGLDEPVDGVTPERLATNEAALAWFRAERPVLLAAVTCATDGFDDLAWRLAWNVGVCLEVDGDWRTRAAVLLEALPSAERAGPPDAPARLHRSIGLAYGRLREHDRAQEHTGTALRLFKALGDRPNQAHCLGILGSNREEAGRYREAITAAEEAYRIFGALGDDWGRAKALVSRGWLHSLVDEYGETVALCTRAIPLLTEAGDRMGQAAALDSIGYAYLHLGRPREAVTYFRRSIEALPGAGFQYFEAISLDHLGDAYHALNELSAARQAWQSALAVFTRMDAPQAPDLRAKLAALNRRLTPVLAVP